jgi:hypothetical protein
VAGGQLSSLKIEIKRGKLKIETGKGVHKGNERRGVSVEVDERNELSGCYLLVCHHVTSTLSSSILSLFLAKVSLV